MKTVLTYIWLLISTLVCFAFDKIEFFFLKRKNLGFLFNVNIIQCNDIGMSLETTDKNSVYFFIKHTEAFINQKKHQFFLS